jgi:hypothetical protein
VPEDGNKNYLAQEDGADLEESAYTESCYEWFD